MKLQERVTRILESLFLTLFMSWTVGTTIALLIPDGGRERQGVVEIYSLTDAAGSNSHV